MASVRPITVTIKGDYTDKDIKRAITDLKSLEKQSGTTGKSTSKMGHELESVGKSYKAAFAGIGAGIVASLGAREVMSFFQDTMAIAIEDDKALRSLAVTYQNLGLSIPAQQTDEWLSSLSRATGIAKGEMIPAIQKLVTSTGDYTKSQQALQVAMDVSQGSGGTKGLMDVVVALSKAYAGNFTAITRLNSGIDANIIATHDMDKIMAALSAKYAGQASAAADTYAGKLARISVAADLAKEKIGYSLIKAIDSMATSMGGTNGATTAIDQMANGVSGLVTQLGDFVIWASRAKNAADDKNKTDEYSQDLWQKFAVTIPFLGPSLKVLSVFQEDSARASGEQAKQLETVSARWTGYAKTFGTMGGMTQAQIDAQNELNGTLDGTATAAHSAMSAIDKLKTSIDLLTGKRKTIREGTIALGEDVRALAGLDAKPTPVKVKHVKKGKTTWSLKKDAHGNTVMAPGKKFHPALSGGNLALGTETGGKAGTWAMDYASDVYAQITALTDAGKADEANKLYDRSAKYLSSVASQWGIKNTTGFTRSYMPKPPVLAGIRADQTAARISPTNYQNLPGSTTTIYQFSGDLVVADAADAVEQAKKNKRLQALSLNRNTSKIRAGAPR